MLIRDQGIPGGGSYDLDGDGRKETGFMNFDFSQPNWYDPADAVGVPENELPPSREITFLHESGHTVYDMRDAILDENGNIIGLGPNIDWENMWRDIFGFEPRRSYMGFEQ